MAMFADLPPALAERAHLLLAEFMEVIRTVDPDERLRIVLASRDEWDQAPHLLWPAGRLLGWSPPDTDEGGGLFMVVCPEQVAAHQALLEAGGQAEADSAHYFEAVASLAWGHREVWRRYPEMSFADRHASAIDDLAGRRTDGPGSRTQLDVLNTVDLAAIDTIAALS